MADAEMVFSLDRSGLAAGEDGWVQQRQWFARWLEGRLFARRSVETYVERTGAFARWLWANPDHGRELDTALGRDAAVAAFVSQLRATSTVNVSLAALNLYFTWQGLDEPTVDSVSVVRRVLEPLTPAQRSRCLDVAALRRSRDYALFVMALSTGLRESELAGLELEKVELTAHEGTVRAPGPGGVERVLPLDESARRVQLCWLAERGRLLGTTQRRGYFLRAGLGGTISPRRVDGIVRSIGAEAGVADLSPGRVRNTFEQELLDQGRDEGEIDDLMGRIRTDSVRARALHATAAPGAAAKRPASPQRGRGRRVPVVVGDQLSIEF
ncbi:tyrosine-type recombinase/integrase (plasmid) [Nocardia sp. NBC_01377]|uniref:tyrosine-type recombinase/integrase n=1 Tax=Nocardia sp. NBC_01377 TaxID=2903595 RepID=UPI002F906A03